MYINVNTVNTEYTHYTQWGTRKGPEFKMRLFSYKQWIRGFWYENWEQKNSKGTKYSLKVTDTLTEEIFDFEHLGCDMFLHCLLFTATTIDKIPNKTSQATIKAHLTQRLRFKIKHKQKQATIWSWNIINYWIASYMCTVWTEKETEPIENLNFSAFRDRRQWLA